MNPHRKGNAFDQGVPGDPRLTDAIGRRTPKAGGVGVTHTHSGTIITPRRKAAAPGSVKLMWKATKTGMTTDSPALPKFRVKGGILFVQGTRVVVADVAELVATAASGFICLKVVRVSASRAYDGVTPASIVWKDTAPVSDYAEEFTVLAEYSESTGVVQCRNDEICSFELLIVANGEYKLLPFHSNSRNSYDPPA